MHQIKFISGIGVPEQFNGEQTKNKFLSKPFKDKAIKVYKHQ